MSLKKVIKDIPLRGDTNSGGKISNITRSLERIRSKIFGVNSFWYQNMKRWKCKYGNRKGCHHDLKSTFWGAKFIMADWSIRAPIGRVR